MGAERRRAQFIVASVREDLRAFPDEVKRQIGFDLGVVQDGDTPEHASQMRGFDPAVQEIKVNGPDATYRCCVTVKLKHRVYVLHAFKKKSTKDDETPEKELRTIRRRLTRAVQLDKEHEQKDQERERRGA